MTGVGPVLPEAGKFGGLTPDLSDVGKLVCEITARRGWRQRLAVRLVKRNRFLDDAAQLVEDLALVAPMAAAVNEAWSAPDEAGILLGPCHYFCVSGARRHFLRVLDGDPQKRSSRPGSSGGSGKANPKAVNEILKKKLGV